MIPSLALLGPHSLRNKEKLLKEYKVIFDK
jgi:hypothetical protein